MTGSSVLSSDLPLSDTFRYIHGPLVEENAPGHLGHGTLADTLRERLRRSDGGAFLVTGFRGVGKTTLVRSTLRALAREDTRRRYLTVSLNVARPISSNEFLFAVMRRVVETLDDTGLLGALEEPIRKSILLAYARTSMSLTARSEEGHELARSFAAAGQLPFAGLAPKLERNTKTTRSLATEASFLAYADADVEHDFLRIVDLLRWSGHRRSGHPPRRRWRRRRCAPPIHLVVVIDELDKLTSSPRGADCFDEILTVFKNVLTASAAHFIFVAGVDVLDRATTDSTFGIGIFESVFSWRVYVPCIWDGGRNVLREASGWRTTDADSFDLVAGYLEYKGRGVPRRLMQELNDLVLWNDGRPLIHLNPDSRERLSLYADLSTILDTLLGRSGGEGRSLEEDRFRLGAYYVADWVLRSEGGVFTATDVVSGESALSPLLSLSERRVDLVLRHLAGGGVIENQRPESSGDGTLVGGVSQARMASYRLSHEMRRRVLRVARANERESLDLLGGVIAGGPAGTPGARPAPETTGTNLWRSRRPAPGSVRPAPPEDPEVSSTSPRVPRSERFMGGERYELLDVLGVGGMGTVYVARDTRLGVRRAIKVLSSTFNGEEEARTRFLREARIALRLDHPNIVRTYQLLDEVDGRLGIVMDLVDGLGLNRLLREIRPRPSAAEAIQIAKGTLRAIEYLHNLDIVRLDVKPSNIIISTDGRPVIIDFGVARSFERDSTQVTGDGLVGTPAYMAPEQITGQPVDHRTDIFSFGLVLLELFGGAHPGAGSIENVMFRRVYEDVDVAPLTCSQELKALIRKCCRRDRELRYSNGTELYQALLAVPEENATLPPNAFGWVTSRVSDAGGDPDSTASPGEHGSGIPRFRPSDPNDPNSTRVLI